MEERRRNTLSSTVMTSGRRRGQTNRRTRRYTAAAAVVAGTGMTILAVVSFLMMILSLSSLAAAAEATRYQGEDASVYDNVEVRRDDNVQYTGYNNRGYADFGGQGSTVGWIIDVPSTGQYALTVRYSSLTARPVDVVVDSVAKGSFDIVPTPSWNEWTEESITLRLDSGVRTIQLKAADAQGGPNVDWISLVPDTASSGTTTGGKDSNRLSLTTVLGPLQTLARNQFRYSPGQIFRTGLDATGQLVIQDAVTSSIIWSSGRGGGDQVIMQDDGNLVVRDQSGSAVWNSGTFGPGAKFAIDDRGVAAIVLGTESLWLATSIATALPSGQDLRKGEFRQSPEGRYVVGLDQDGQLKVLDSGRNEVWSSGVSGGEACFMQGDGNLVVRDAASVAIWTSGTGRSPGARLTIDDGGKASLMLGESIVWSTAGIETNRPPVANRPSTTTNLVEAQPTTTTTTTTIVVNPNSKTFDSNVVLTPRASIPRDRFIASPGNKFRVGLQGDGNFVFQRVSDSKTLWASGTSGGVEAYMQPDGNFVIRDAQRNVLWTTHTSKNNGARLEIDDGGRLALMKGKTSIWVQGIPRGTYTGPSSPDLQYPLRTTFYYPWYPETWTVNGAKAKYIPSLGEYSSDDPAVVEDHIDQMEYGYFDLVVASWWGPDQQQERSRLSLLMDKTIEMKSSMKWSVYHEHEFGHDPTPTELKGDLDYLKKWFAWHPAFAHKDGKPMILVYNEGGTCDIVRRWMEANQGEWYVVLKLFGGYKDCAMQPDSWHQYGPSTEVIHVKGVTTAISPGFWRADFASPTLARVPPARFCQNVQKMVNDGEKWQVVTTFNEQGEGTSIEATNNWSSETRYGAYLDCLHRHH
mmetsp:Transcript_43062/g.104190  ORF Transcript_43062/g.104190 Transcript_43062/m.104190 type:complete len:859 (+) Transcript_43062:349-2925(+)